MNYLLLKNIRFLNLIYWEIRMSLYRSRTLNHQLFSRLNWMQERELETYIFSSELQKRGRIKAADTIRRRQINMPLPRMA